MLSSLRQALTSLHLFRVMYYARFKALAGRRQSAGASRTSNESSRKEVMTMLKVGDKIVVSVKVTQIIEDKDGVCYTVERFSDDNRSSFYQSMRVTKEDIRSIVE